MDEDGSTADAGGSGGEAPGGRRRAPQRKPIDPAIDLDALLAAHRRHAVTELPRGRLGAGTAVELVGAFVEGCRRRLPDVTASGPQLMTFLVEHGLHPAMPSPRVIPAALGLVSAVSPLLEARSERVWTAWFARVHDEGSRVAERIRRMTPASQLAVVERPPVARPMRSAALLAERDRLAADLVVQRAENEKLRGALTDLKAQFTFLYELFELVQKGLTSAFDATKKLCKENRDTMRMVLQQDMDLAEMKAELAARKVPGHTEADVENARTEERKRLQRRDTSSASDPSEPASDRDRS